jgi:hypothetical protein
LQLEKEAMNNGTSPGQAHDIDIPPPRPKRKPNSPYPRKNGLSSETSTREVSNDKSIKSNMGLSSGKVETAGHSSLQVSFPVTFLCQDFTNSSSVLLAYSSISVASRNFKGRKYLKKEVARKFLISLGRYHLHHFLQLTKALQIMVCQVGSNKLKQKSGT